MCQAIGIPFREVTAFEIDGKPVSSSRVRRAIEEGQIDEAIHLLNRPYCIHGTVVEGAKRGRTIGIPTANLDCVETILPAQGVYAVKVNANGIWYTGAGNIGPNPTFGENARKIEIHLIDFSGDLYGQNLRVEFLARLRETKKFSSVDELIQQMKADITFAKEIGNRG
jgi:riboflavin kinase/FMN adenylyltransferase